MERVTSDQRHTVMGTLKLALCILIMLTSFTFVAEASNSAVQVDCYDSTGSNNQTTKNLITVSVWGYDDELLEQDSMVPNCNSVLDASYIFDNLFTDEGAEVEDIAYFVIQTNGTDAFWMDEVRLTA